MEALVHMTARLVRAVQKAYGRKWSFLVLTLLAFTVSVYVLAAFDLLPDAPKTPSADAAPAVSLARSPSIAPAAVTAASPVAHSEAPVEVVIPSISLTAPVANPTTTDVETLDQLLLSGAVRYPTSAMLGENGNVVIFGHSSYLPIVRNEHYKTFDGIQKLKAGDTITVYSSDAVYTYAVRSVVQEDATEAIIPLSVSGKVLTLSTCDVFGQKSERFIVTADFVSSHALGT